MARNSEKNPAAVALGKRRQAAMTDEERRQFARTGSDAARPANAARTPEECRRISRKAAMTRRRGGRKLAPVIPIAPPAAVSDAEALARELAELPDDLIARMADALKGAS